MSTIRPQAPRKFESSKVQKFESSDFNLRTNLRTFQLLNFPTPQGLDIAAAAVGLALLSPIMLGIGVAIKLHDGGPVFHRAVRVGKDGKPFRLYKFRTMIAG